jgi:hypothetical protein
MTLSYLNPAVARLYVDAVLSLSELGMPRFGRPLVLANYTDVAAPTLRDLPARGGGGAGRRGGGAGPPPPPPPRRISPCAVCAAPQGRMVSCRNRSCSR